MDRETLRHLLFEYLEGDPATQLTTIYTGVTRLAISKEYIDPPQDRVAQRGDYSYQTLPVADRLTLQELTWELILQGILTPGMNESNLDLPFVRLTEYGTRCVQEREVLPHDYGTYLEKIRTLSTSTDPTFLLYLTESVQAFNKGLYISTVVNLGIASERLTLLLIDAYKNALKAISEKTKFEEAIRKARHIAHQFDELYKRLEAKKGSMPTEISQNLDMVRYLEELIRKERNDAGHPTGRTFTREEALLLLITFPSHYKTVVALLLWLQLASI